MKFTVRIISLIMLLLITGQAFTQNPYFGVKAGFNMSHFTLKDNDRRYTKDFNLKPGFNAGVVLDYRIIPELTLNSSLLVSSKGYLERRTETFKGVTVKSTYRQTLMYFELPVYLKYEFELGLFDVFAGGGGFVAYGYWGKNKWTRKGGGETEEEKSDVYWGNDPAVHDYVNLDYGVGIVVGIQVENFVLDIGYNYSIANISTDKENGRVARNGVFFASVSYFFSPFYRYAEGNF
jgi:hypothetical protein